ncbi:MAG: ComEC family competence protein [Oscillospiraceae bacterium]|nr:ComEC family competence protein [Oscillospiraceae bacterium]
MRRYIFIAACIFMLVIYVLITYFDVSFINLWGRQDIHTHIGVDAWVVGRVVSPPQLTRAGFHVHFVLDAETIETATTSPIPVSGRIFVRAPAEDDINFGDTITFFAELSQPAGARFDGGFDFALFLRQQDVYVAADARRTELVQAAGADYSLTGIGVRIRQSIVSAIDDNFSGIFGRFYPNNEVAGVVKSIMVGDRSDITDEVRLDFSRAGIGHILAVSGMHVGILFSILSFLLLKFRVRKLWAYIVGILVLLLFMSVALYTPSVTRATIMMIIFLAAYIFQKNPDQLTSLGIAAIVILALNPYSITSPGFLLSFGSVAGILIFYQPFNAGLQSLSARATAKTKLKIHKRIPESLAMSSSTFLATVFFTAYFFNILTFGGFLTNLVAMPFVAFIMVGGFVVWAVSWIPILSTIVAYIVSIPVVFILEVANFVAGMRFLWTHVPTPGAAAFMIYLGVIMVFYILTKNKKALS